MSAPRRSLLPLLLAAPASATVLRASSGVVSAGDVLDVPDMRAYDPVEVLCAKGKDADGHPNIQGWCQNWLSCIKAGATPAGDAAAVRSAWKPADCREVCGAWPTVAEPEGSSASFLARLSGVRGAASSSSKGAVSSKDCQASCENFQESLTSCVATILFEPGKVAAMGIPQEGQPAAPAHCTSKTTECMPDLPVQYQTCLAKSKNSASECKNLKVKVEDCKDCPQLSQSFLSHYHTFVGGCMDQLNAYWQATHPSAIGGAIPGAAGCKVH